MEGLRWEGCYQIRMLGRSWSWSHEGNVGWGDTECREPDKTTLPKKRCLNGFSGLAMVGTEERNHHWNH